MKLNNHVFILMSCLGVSTSVLLNSCASTPKVADHSEIKIETTEKQDLSAIPIVKSTTSTGITKYKFEKTEGTSQWIKCTSAKTRGTVLVMHRFGAGFDPNLFCNGWVAQAFVKKGFQVVAVNRPSYVESSGTEDLAGPTSIAAIKAGLDASGSAAQLVGVWGYDVGAIAASYFAKQTPAVKWLILGGGIYDLEITERSTDNAALKSAIQKIKSTEGDVALERRSIAWDFKDLTKTIALYHAKDDKFAPVNQAEAFNSQLRTAEYKVFDNEIAGGSHSLPWRDHMKIVEAAIDQVAPNKETK